jgi:outer membrane protein assembly factor BamB
VPFPSTITLPVGFRPEGVAVGAGSEFFVGSLGTLADENAPIVGGAIYRGDLRTGQGQQLVQAKAGQMAVGLQVDRRTHCLYVAGGMFGDVRVYNASTGRLVISYTLGSEGGFINDLVVTKAAVYATDSFLPFLYSVPLSSSGQPTGTTGAKLALGIESEADKVRG